MSLISEQDKEYLQEEFGRNLKRKVELLYFEEKGKESEYSLQTKELLKELVALNDNLSLTLKNCEDAGAMESEGLYLCPSIKVKSERSGFVNFYGIPAGHEFTSLIEAINDMGSDNLSLPDDVIKGLKEIDSPVDIKVFITHGCPYCPGAVRNAHQFSLVNEKIKGSMVDANYFDNLSRKHQVSSVPHIVVNDRSAFTGNMSPKMFLDKIKESLQ
jgi:glutaredoxin-like protein